MVGLGQPLRDDPQHVNLVGGPGQPKRQVECRLTDEEQLNPLTRIDPLRGIENDGPRIASNLDGFAVQGAEIAIDIRLAHGRNSVAMSSVEPWPNSGPLNWRAWRVRLTPSANRLAPL
jgi:hypothetical protein